jgi:hypothetical protein
MAEAMLSPVVLGAMVVVIANDHALKRQWPGLVTGKLSDVAGLIVLPVLLVALLEGSRLALGMRDPAGTEHDLALTAAVSAMCFSAVKTSTWVAAAYSDVLGWLQWPFRAAQAFAAGEATPGHMTVTVLADPWDLIALPAIGLGVAAALRARRQRPGLIRPGGAP